jgi:hypothetical protein
LGQFLPCAAQQTVTQFIDKVVGANGTLEKEEGPPSLGSPPSTFNRTYLSPSQQPRARLPNRLVDKSYCRCANGNAASVTLASQTPISPSSMPAFPTLHSSCHRRHNATQWAIQFVRCRLPAPSKSAGSGQSCCLNSSAAERHVRSTPASRPLCATRKSAESGQLQTCRIDVGGEAPSPESGNSEIKPPDQITRLDDGRLLNRCLSFPASDSSQSRKVTIFGRFAVALGQTIQ